MSDYPYVFVFCGNLDLQNMLEYPLFQHGTICRQVEFINPAEPLSGLQRRLIAEPETKIHLMIIGPLGRAAMKEHSAYIKKHKPELFAVNDEINLNDKAIYLETFTSAVEKLEKIFAERLMNEKCDPEDQNHLCHDCGGPNEVYCNCCGRDAERFDTAEQTFEVALKRGWTFFSALALHRALLCPDCAYDHCSRCNAPMLEKPPGHLVFHPGVFMVNIHIPDNETEAPFNSLVFCCDCFNELSQLIQPFLEEGKTKN